MTTKKTSYIFKTLPSALIFLLNFILFDAAFGYDVTKIQINITKPIDGLSYNQAEQAIFDSKKIIINNNDNKKISSADTIVFIIAGNEESKLKSKIEISGKKAKLILVNPNGIICNGCYFINIKEAELRAEDICIENRGIIVSEGSLTLNSEKISIAGEIFAKNINLFADGENAAVKISALETIFSDLNGKAQKAIIGEGNIYINSSGDVSIGRSISSLNNLKIQGKNIFITPSIAYSVNPRDATIDACPEEICNIAHIKSGNSMELEGDNIYLNVLVKLESKGSFLKITGKVFGLGSIKSKTDLTILSPGKISLNTIHAHGDIFLVAADDISVSSFNAGKIGEIQVVSGTDNAQLE